MGAHDQTVFGPPQETFTVKVDGRSYPVLLDERGEYVFEGNRVLQWLVDRKAVSLVKVAIGFQLREFSLREYAEFYMALGISVDAFTQLPDFKHMQIELPLWRKKREKKR